MTNSMPRAVIEIADLNTFCWESRHPGQTDSVNLLLPFKEEIPARRISGHIFASGDFLLIFTLIGYRPVGHCHIGHHRLEILVSRHLHSIVACIDFRTVKYLEIDFRCFLTHHSFGNAIDLTHLERLATCYALKMHAMGYQCLLRPIISKYWAIKSICYPIWTS